MNSPPIDYETLTSSAKNGLTWRFIGRWLLYSLVAFIVALGCSFLIGVIFGIAAGLSGHANIPKGLAFGLGLIVGFIVLYLQVRIFLRQMFRKPFGVWRIQLVRVVQYHNELL